VLHAHEFTVASPAGEEQGGTDARVSLQIRAQEHFQLRPQRDRPMPLLPGLDLSVCVTGYHDDAASEIDVGGE
jgi:hypothetical protein